MKILILETMYIVAEKNFYTKYPELLKASYEVQKRKFDENFNYWAAGWCDALNERGYLAENIIVSVKPLQQAWKNENFKKQGTDSLHEIAIQQIKHFNPDVLWFDMIDAELLQKIKETCPKIRLILGWVGSAIAKSKQWEYLDIICSCAPESVERLNNAGYCAKQLHHAFNPKVLKYVNKKEEIRDEVSFIGQIVRENEFHLQREKLLLELSGEINLKIYSPSFYFGYGDMIDCMLKKILYYLVVRGRQYGFEGLINQVPIIKKSLKWQQAPNYPINFKLKRKLKKPVFGLDMFQTIRSSAITLNVHADTSPLYASNMRLFETTGMGSCLITEKKKNINELFIADKEIVTYNSSEDCVEKIKWLMEHPIERRVIANAGKERCLKDHTFEQRVNRLEAIIYSKI